MVDKGNSYDQVWAPPAYNGLNPDSDGYWTVLSSPSGSALGVAWRDDDQGTGFIPASSGPMANSLRNHFTSAATLNIPASSAYELAQVTPGVTASESGSGKLNRVYSILASINPDQAEVDAVLSDQLSVNPFFLTLNDTEEQVLELVLADGAGIFIRDNGQWVEIGEDNDRVFDRIIVDVDPSIVEYFDDVAAKNGNDSLTASDFKKFEID